MADARSGASEPRFGVVRTPESPISALAVAGLAAVLLSAGAAVPVVRGAVPGFASFALLVVLALTPVVIAGVLVAKARHAAASGVLVGAALLAPARFVLDLQFAAGPSVVSRPELYAPAQLAAPAPATGLWLLLAGHAATALAGMLALGAAGRQATDPPDTHGVADTHGTDGPDAWRRRWLLVAVLCAVVAACGLVMAPFGSTDAYLPARNAFEGPAVALFGYLLAAGSLPLGVALLVTSSHPMGFVRGGLCGAALAVAVFELPNVAAGLSMDSLDVAAGPVVALVAAAGLAAVAATRAGVAREADDGTGRAPEPGVPGRRRLEQSTGVSAVLTCAAAVAGAFTAQLTTPASLPTPESPARWLLLVAGLLVGALGAAMLVPGVAARVRPVLSAAWAAVPLAGAAVLSTAITATGVTGAVSSGPGVLWTWLAMVAALVTACCCAVAGFVEREDADTGLDADGRVTRAGLRMLMPLAAAAVLAVAAFGSPVVVAPHYVEPGLWSDLGPPSWGLLTALLTVLGALALAPTSRPARAAALLAGAVCLLGLRAATLPLVGGQIEGASPGTGLWFALAAIVAVSVSAGIAALGDRPT